MKHKLSQFITLFILVLILFVYINWQEENRWAGVFAETMNTTQDDLDKGYISIIVPHEEPVAAVKINIQGNDFESIDGYDLVLSDTLWKGIIGGIPVGQDREVEVSAYDLSENLIFTGTACLDIIGNHAATVIITLKSATLPETDPGKPVIENVVIFPDKVAPGDSINLDITAYTIDPDEQLNYHWDCPDGGMFEDPLSPVTYWISPGSNGIFQLRITVSDNEGNSDTLTFNVEVDEKYGTDSIPYEVQCFSSWNWHYYYAPRIRYIYADPVFVERGSSTNLGVCVYDRFYSDLNYHWYTRIPGSFDNPDQKNPVFTVSPHASTGWHKIKVIVSNKNYSALGIKWIKVIEASNIPPVINSINADPSVIYRGGTSALSVDAYDPDGDPLVYEWNSNAPGIFDDIHAANPVFIADNDAAYGKYIITVIVSDGTSNITQWVYLEIKPFNSSPVIESIAINPPGVYKGESAELRVIAADPESDALTYTWSTTCPGSFDDPTVANPVFTVDMTADYRAYPVIVIVSDGKTQVAGSVDITVKEKNSSPVIESITINPPGVYKGESAELRVIAADPEGDALTYTWSTACPGSFDDPTITNPVFTVDDTADYRAYPVIVIVSDGKTQVAGSVDITVKEKNSFPVIESITINPPGVYKGESAELRVIAADPEGDALTYTWSTACPGSFDDPTVANPVFTVDDTADYRTYPVEVIVSDGKTQVAGSVDITVENNPPFIFLLTATPGRLDKGEITELAVEVIDPDEDPLSFLWSTTCPGSFDNPMNQYPNFTVSNDAEYTEYSITIQVSDGTYNIEESIPVVVEDLNDPPVIKSINANPTRIPKGGSTQLEVYAVDPDQDELTYQWTATETGIFYDADTATPVFTVHDEVEYGECTITAYVTDKKETTTASITINIWDPGINQAPVILTSFQGTDEIEAGKQVIFRVRAKDPEGSNLTFLWKKTAGILGIPANVITDNYTESIMVWTAPAYTVNPVVIKVDISDEAGLTVTKEFLPVTIKQGIVPNSDPEIECKLELQDKSSNAMFGYAADIYANRIAASYVKEDSLGAVAVYEIIDNTFTRVAVLQASDEQTGDYYGRSLSIDQDIIAAGAFSEDGGDGDPLIDCGAVYIYERQENGNWIDKQILHASDAEKYDRFGSAIAVDNIYLAVGAIQEDGGPDAPAANCGAVYIYKRDLAGKWNESTVLYGSDKSKSDFFGCAVDIRENYLIVGAKGRDEAGGINNGVAYIFKRNPDDTWEEQTILRAPDSQYGDYFGSSVAISTSYAVVGAEKEDGGTGDPAKDCGAVYLFRLNEETGVWALASILHAPDKQEDDAYGCAVSLYNDLVIIGALGNNAGEQNDITDSGAVYIYRILSNEACSLLKKYYAPDAGVGDYFGNSVSVYGNLAVVGARGEDGGEENSFDNAGALYIIRF